MSNHRYLRGALLLQESIPPSSAYHFYWTIISCDGCSSLHRLAWVGIINKSLMINLTHVTTIVSAFVDIIIQ